MKTLSLDLSTKSSGWAIFKDKDLQDSGCFVDGNANVLKRIIYMTSRIEELICTNDIDEVIIEEVLPEDVRHNQKVYKSLMYLQASVVLMLFKHNLNANFFTSSEWRKKCGIHTGAGIKRDTLKAADINFVKEHFEFGFNMLLELLSSPNYDNNILFNVISLKNPSVAKITVKNINIPHKIQLIKIKL